MERHRFRIDLGGTNEFDVVVECRNSVEGERMLLAQYGSHIRVNWKGPA